MGQEFDGTITVGGQKVNIRADFGSDRVRFSGGRRGDVPYKQVQVLGTSKGILRIRADGAEMQFAVGANVDRLANKIRSPPGRLDKMGIKPGLSAAIVGDLDDAFVAELRAVLPDVATRPPTGQVDLIVLAVRSLDELGQVAALAPHLTPDGGLWVVYRKGKRDPSELDVITAGRAAGLRDFRVARFSETHTALKFVVPLEQRPAA